MDINDDQLQWYRQRAVKWAQYMGRNLQDAEDKAQEALIRFLRVRKPIRFPRTYFFRIVKNLVADQKKAERESEPLAPNTPETETCVSVPGKAQDLKKFIEVYRECAKRLPWKERLVVELSYLHGLTARDIAKLTGWPQGTVDSYKKRGRERLRSMPELQGFHDLLSDRP